MNPITIAQITDIHIAEEGRLPNGVDVRANFLKVLKGVKEANVDYMVISGDLCCDIGIIEVYEWVKSHLDAVEIPYFVLSGNHDDPSMIAEIFEMQGSLQKGDLYYSHKIESLGQFIFLDSTVGRVSSQQLSFLTNCCKDTNEPQLLFIHHPPTLASVAHMDKNYSLQNIEEVQTAIKACASRPQAIFCGHYHCERSISLPDLGTTVFISPSSAYFQINPNIDDFEIDSYQSAWRKILWDGKTVKSSIKYVNKNYSL
ncbi:MAG: metallophosphoesterase [Chitinophagales bacterium]